MEGKGGREDLGDCVAGEGGTRWGLEVEEGGVEEERGTPTDPCELGIDLSSSSCSDSVEVSSVECNSASARE